jgi:hypothetical protein
MLGLLLLAGAGAHAAGASTPFQLTLVNNGRHTLSAANVSPSQGSDWGSNLLAAPLGPQQQVIVTVSGDCGQYDVRFDAEKGTRLHEEGLALCDGDTLTIGDRTVTHTKASP